MKLDFTKMHGAGNDYVYVCDFEQTLPADLSELAKQMSHRRYGIGGDGLILIRPSNVADARMQMFNADGGEGEMCGNGIRCVAKYVVDRGIVSGDHLNVETGAGVLAIDVHRDDRGAVASATVDMGTPILEASKIPTTMVESGRVVEHAFEVGGRNFLGTCVSMGNPHCVIFVPEATDELVLEFGPMIERDPRFPNRANIEFVELISPTEVRQRTWERGSGETWACGTGASAVCVAGVLTGRTEREILNHLVGGDLTLRWDEATDHVFMTGPAAEVYSGQWEC